MDDLIHVRPLERFDYDGWRPLWDGYNAFYGRVGTTALPEEITASTWERFFSQEEPVRAQVALCEEKVVGLVHYLFHRSTTRLENVCYLQDLFTGEPVRGKGIGRRLVLAVHDDARLTGCSRVYWHTQSSNTAGRALYDKVGEYKGFIVYANELPHGRTTK